MAESKDNIIVKGLSGKLGVIIFRQQGGKTFASMAPGPRGSDGTPLQLSRRSRFQQAVIYGKAVIADPVAKEVYQGAATGGQRAFNVAIADVMNAPDITEIDMSGYSGKPGETIRIRVTDDFKVKSVRLVIYNGDGSLQENGQAALDVNGADWIYTTTTDNDNLVGDKIVIEATDNPDNLTTEEWLLSER